MKISLKLEYACRVLAQLARTAGQSQLVQVETLAELEHIPPNYLVQILNELRGAGLVQSRRGKAGGYALAKAPEDVTLAEVVRVIEPEILAPRPVSEGHSAHRVQSVWEQVGETLETKLKGFTIVDLIAEKQAGMYYI